MEGLTALFGQSIHLQLMIYITNYYYPYRRLTWEDLLKRDDGHHSKSSLQSHPYCYQYSHINCEGMYCLSIIWDPNINTILANQTDNGALCGEIAKRRFQFRSWNGCWSEDLLNRVPERGEEDGIAIGLGLVMNEHEILPAERLSISSGLSFSMIINDDDDGHTLSAVRPPSLSCSS